MEELSWDMIHVRNQGPARIAGQYQRRGQGAIRSIWLLGFVLIGLAGLSAGHHAIGQEPAAQRSRGVAVLVDVDGAIGPASVRHVENAIAEAEERHR